MAKPNGYTKKQGPLKIAHLINQASASQTTWTSYACAPDATSLPPQPHALYTLANVYYEATKTWRIASLKIVII